jgi:hypothetical protein
LNGCTGSFTSFSDLLIELQKLQADNITPIYQGAGTIFVEQGNYAGSETAIVLDSNDLSNISGSDLTVQGGWNTTNNTIDTTSSSNFNVPITIGSSSNPWVGTLTINNISISGVNNQTGLTLNTDGDINLNQVEVTNSQSGIDLNAGGGVALKNVDAKGNDKFGAHIKGQDVAIDTANFSDNGSGSGSNLTGSGVQVNSQDSVSLASVTADNNQLFGADIVAGGLVAVELSSFSGHLTYVNGNVYGGGYGLRVETSGDIAVEGVTADNNYLYGADLKGNDTAVLGRLDQTGTLVGSSFSNNGSGVMTDPPGNGYGYGLAIDSTGGAEIYDTKTNNNQFFGTDVKAIQDVVVVNSFFSGNQSQVLKSLQDKFDFDFYGYGLTVSTDADISLDYVVGNVNNLWGAKLIGNNVWVSNSQFNDNVSDSPIFIDDTGLIVDANGFVDLYKVEAKRNRLIGATITAAGDVFVADSTFTENRGWTCGQHNGQHCYTASVVFHGTGLDVTTPSLIQVTNTNASDNNLFGATLNGGVVTVADSIFNNNSLGNGLIVNTADNVLLTNVTAGNNNGNGVDVTGVCEKVVQVNGGTFADNILYGIQVLDSTLFLDGAQVFANNSTGDYLSIFTDPATCIVVTSAPLITTTTGTNTDQATPATDTTSTTTVQETLVTDTTGTTTDQETPVITSVTINNEQGSTLTQNSDTSRYSSWIKKVINRLGGGQRFRGHHSHRHGG